MLAAHLKSPHHHHSSTNKLLAAMNAVAPTHRLRLGMAMVALVCVWSQMHSFFQFGGDCVLGDHCETTSLLEGGNVNTATRLMSSTSTGVGGDDKQQSQSSAAAVKELEQRLQQAKKTIADLEEQLGVATKNQRQQQQPAMESRVLSAETSAEAAGGSDRNANAKAKNEKKSPATTEPRKTQKASDRQQKVANQQQQQQQQQQQEKPTNDNKRPKRYISKNPHPPPVEKKPEDEDSSKNKKKKKPFFPKEAHSGVDTIDVKEPTKAREFFNQLAEANDTSIRRWGCTPRNETPFIFVHIGKAGGGGVRSRMAAAATDYNRSGWHRTHEDPHYYYPVYDDEGVMHKGKFWSSIYASWIPKSTPQFHGDFEYEGYGFCGATTPLGSAIACPNEQLPEFCSDKDNDTISDHRCDLVYMGHNVINAEMHWLPTSYLINWWNTSIWGQRPENEFVANFLQERHMKIVKHWHVNDKVKEIVGGMIPKIHCDKGPYHYRELKRQYKKCFQPKEAIVDRVYHYVMGDDPMQAARLTASLPVLRVTVLREPFTWLLSKFFWHPQHWSRNSTIVVPDGGPGRNNHRIHMDKKKNRPTPPFIKCDDLDEAAYGWAENRAMGYMFYLCGEHCMGAWAAGTLSLEDLERQSAYNLRNSFAVVGLLHKTNEFYQMVTHRVFYMDTSLNPEVKGKAHTTNFLKEARRCKDIYTNTTFQEALLAKSPALSALNRLYKIAVEVNTFQKQEMEQCGYEIIPTDVSKTK